MPKFVNSENTSIIKAVKEFTDREEPRKVFWDKYDFIKNNMHDNKVSPINVITYYGYGGIGKSRLLLRLRDEIIEKESNTKYEFLDFEKVSELNNNLLEILRYIRYDLNKKYNFSFPFFDLVTYEYETRLGKDVTKKELESIFEENRILNILTDVLEEIPIISPIAKIVSIVDRSKTVLKSKLQENRLKDKLLEFNKMTAEEMKSFLPYYFSVDLKENIKNENTPFVFLIDTYEKLVNELSSSGNVLDNDLWLRGDNGLILNIPNTLWVLAGREKLKWEEIDSDWVGSIEQHLLKNLSFQDTRTFLLKASIDNEDLIHQIYDLTNGYPIFLDMCVDIYISLSKNGKTFTIEDFGRDTTELTKRFFMYMNDSERDFSTLLAFIPYWTDEDIEERVLKLNGNFSYSLYEKVKTFSFIVKEDGHYKVQNSIRDIIIMDTPDSLKNKYNRLIEAQVLEQVKEIDIKEDLKIEKELNHELIENLKAELKKEISEETILQMKSALESNMNTETAERIIEEAKEEIKKEISKQKEEQQNNKENQESIKEEKIVLDARKEKKEEPKTIIQNKQELKAISNFNNYSSKYEFEKIIEIQRRKLDNSKTENEFKVNANLFIKLILQYEEKFNRNYIVDKYFYSTVKQWNDFKELIESKKLKIFEKNAWEFITFEEFEKVYGDTKDALFAEIHKCRWQDISRYKNRIKFENDKVKELVIKYYGEDSLYGYCTLDNDYEFVEKVLNYNGEINNFYIKLLFMTLNEKTLESYLEKKYPKVKLTFDYTYSGNDYILGYEFYHIHMHEIFKDALKKYFNVLKENESFIDYSVLKDIFSLADRICDYDTIFDDSWTYYDIDDANTIFDFIYCIRYIALKTTDVEIMLKFKELFYTFLGGINNDKRTIFTKEKENLSKEFLKELSDHFVELYGDSSYDSYEINNFLNKEVMSPERLDKALNVLIDNFGPKSLKVTKILIQFLSGIHKYQVDKYELKSDEQATYNGILEKFNDYINILLKYFKEYEFDYNYEHDKIRSLFKSIIDDDEHIKYLDCNTFDNIIMLASSKNKCFFDDDVVEYLRKNFRHMTIQQTPLSSGLENKYEQIFWEFCKDKRILEMNNYDNTKIQICDSYVIYKFFTFLNNTFKKTYELNTWKNDEKYGNLKNIDNNNFEDVGDALKYLIIKCAKPREYSDSNDYGFFYNINNYCNKHYRDIEMERIRIFFHVIDDLYRLYKDKYGIDSDKTILLKAYKCIFESLMYMKSGSEMLDIEVQKYRNKANKNEDTLKELEKLKLVKDYYVFLITYYYKEQCDEKKRHDFKLQNWTLDEIINNCKCQNT